MIEEFDPKYDDFFEEASYLKRWERLANIYKEGYPSFRVLFIIETLAVVEKWAEPTPEQLKRMWDHKRAGGVLGIRFENLKLLILPLWTIEIAKAEVQIYRIAHASDFHRKFPLTALRCHSSALLHAWWSLEALMNDFAAIIAEQRKDSLSEETKALLQETRPRLDKTGTPVEEPYYQAVHERIQFIFRLLTGRPLDRESNEWRHIMELKKARDGYVHRLGKPGGMEGFAFGEATTVLNGMAAVRSIIRQVITETPEFAVRFGYKFLAFWSCGMEAPFVWDGNEGGCFYFGPAEPKPESIVSLFAPVPGNLGRGGV